MALEEVNGGIVNAGDERWVHNSILAGTGNVNFINLSYHALRRAVGAPDTNLIHSDGVSLPHAWSGNIFGSGHKDFNTVFADEAMEGCKPFIIFRTGEREVVGRIRIQWLGRRVEGR
jgi:hypothetical protein